MGLFWHERQHEHAAPPTITAGCVNPHRALATWRSGVAAITSSGNAKCQRLGRPRPIDELESIEEADLLADRLAAFPCNVCRTLLICPQSCRRRSNFHWRFWSMGENGAALDESRKGRRALVSHRSRPRFHAPTPVHVTLRVSDAIPSLRSSRRFAKIRECLARARGRFGVRLAEYSVLGNHLHFIIEADDNVSLSRGVQGLCIRLARALNADLDRRGRVFADHFHSRLLRTPTELCRAIRYLRENGAHHYGERGVDAFSSAARGALAVLAAALGWLLRLGWNRAPNAIAPATYAAIRGPIQDCCAAEFQARNVRWSRVRSGRRRARGRAARCPGRDRRDCDCAAAVGAHLHRRHIVRREPHDAAAARGARPSSREQAG